MTKRVAIYVRVSTDGQTVQNQIDALEEVAERAGWEVVKVYRDDGISGSKGRDARPGLNALLKDAAARRFDLVASWSVDRLGRSLQDLIGLLNELRALDIGLFLHQQGLDTTTPAGRAMFGMLGVFAEFERSMIQERVKAGLNRAKAQGKTLGRRKGSSVKKQNQLQDVLELRTAGRSLTEIATDTGLGRATVIRWLKDAKEAV